jgi:UDP-glucuronate 4-epimerase
VSGNDAPVLVTGAAGFIGFHLTLRLLQRGTPVLGFDNLNDYYDLELKKARLGKIQDYSRRSGVSFGFVRADLEDSFAVEAAFCGKSLQGEPLLENKPSLVVHLAAQAGVRYSLENPATYIQSNMVGFGHVLEGCKLHCVRHLVYASSSSVYGGNKLLPFSERQGVDHPVSLYAATKKANELMAHAYSHLYAIPMTGLRFFTVYGPWGRPDMALFVFTKAMVERRPIQVFNHGRMVRDFTYVDDVVEGILRALDRPPTPDVAFDSSCEVPDPSSSWAPHRIFNVGNSCPTELMDYIHAIELALGVKADIEMLPMQSSDLVATSADTKAFCRWTDFTPSTPVDIGVKLFVDWYCKYYGY